MRVYKLAICRWDNNLQQWVQNGEQVHTRSLLANVEAKYKYWPYAYEKQFNVKPNITNMVPAGFEGIYLGNSSRSKTFYVYNVHSGKVRECDCVTFPTTPQGYAPMDQIMSMKKNISKQ
eukprot:m.287787 g.287787  ORF g.287787 m.287787 type:complete len:119 (+) comp16366_c0_seq2:843-1199(+)